jgi:hypothetical protein
MKKLLIVALLAVGLVLGVRGGSAAAPGERQFATTITTIARADDLSGYPTDRIRGASVSFAATTSNPSNGSSCNPTICE